HILHATPPPSSAKSAGAWGCLVDAKCWRSAAAICASANTGGRSPQAAWTSARRERTGGMRLVKGDAPVLLQRRSAFRPLFLQPRHRRSDLGIRAIRPRGRDDLTV